MDPTGPEMFPTVLSAPVQKAQISILAVSHSE